MPDASPSHLYPGSHCAVLLLTASTYDPGGTAVHVVPAFPEELRPAAHNSQCVWLDVAAIVFSSHSSHSVVALKAEARPGAHSMQATEPLPFAYDPGGQAVRPAASPSHLYPGSHWAVVFATEPRT